MLRCRSAVFNRLDLWLRLRLALADRVVVINDFGGCALNDWLWSAAVDRLMHHTFLPILPLMAFLPFRPILTFRAILPLRTILTLRPELLAFWSLLAIGIVAITVAIVHAIIVIAVIVVLILIPIIALILDRRLSLCSKNNSIVVFGVLEIVFSYHAVTGALCITRKSRIFFGDMLSISPDFYIGTVALVVTG